MTGVRGAQGACAADSGRPGPATPDRPCGPAGGGTATQDGAASATATVVPELFAGPGGWSTALRLAGYVSRSVGVEYDSAACATARAAGHERVLADVADVDPVAFAAGRQVPGLIGSPPCTTFSNAGHGAGRRLVEMLGEAITHAARGVFDRDRVLRRCARVLFRVAEAGVLQSFPPAYPWQGSKTAQYRQVGDAVPPLLGAACLAAVIPAAELAAVVAA